MKKFFKKIAFVSAMATVVSTMPTQSAAAAEGPQMSKWVGFYLGGDASGTYSDKAKYAKVWNWKDDYVSVSFESSNPEVATVTAKKGKVTPLTVGTTTITATFTDEDGETVDKTCKVTVKKNAVEAGISDNSAAALKELTVGDVFQTKTYRVGADGEKTWKGKTVITDGVRFKSSAEDVFTVTSTTGKVTAVGAGKAELSVWAVQTEKPVVDEATGKSVYRPTTEVVKYDVVVKAQDLVSVKQLSTNTVAIDCGHEELAAKVAANPAGLKAVHVLGANEITSYVKSVSVDSNDKTVVNVELYNTLDKDVTYKFSYAGGEAVAVVGADLGAVYSIQLSTTQAQKGTETEIKVDFYDVNGIKINPGSNGLTFSAPESNDYFISGNKIYFFDANKEATVTATYNMGYDTTTGDKIPDITATGKIVSYSPDSTLGQVKGWAVDATGKKASDLTFGTSNVKMVPGDGTKQLYVTFDVTDYWGNVAAKYNVSSDVTQVSGAYEYKSSNDAIVLVNVDGTITAVAAGNAQIIVYRVLSATDKPVVGVINVEVSGSRNLNSFVANADKNILSTGNGDEVVVGLDTKDQLGATYTPIYKVKLLQAVDGVSVAIGNREVTTTEDVYSSETRNWAPAFVITATGTTTSPKTVLVQITAQDPNTWATITKVVTVYVKTPGTIASYKLSVNNIDTNLPAHASWESINKYASDITLKAYDAQGYYVSTIAMTNTAEPADGAYGYTVTKGNEDVPVANSRFEAVVASGATEVAKAKTAGAYVVRVFKGVTVTSNNTTVVKPQLITAATITVTDNTVAPVVIQNNNTLVGVSAGATDAELIAALGANDADGNNDKLTFKRGDKTLSLTIMSVDETIVNGKVFITKVTVKESYAGLGDFVYDVNVGKLFSVTQ